MGPNFIPNPQYHAACSSSTTGITDVTNGNIISAYPNPFDQSITINADVGSPSQMKIELLSLLGQVLISDDFGIVSDIHFQKTISTAGFTAGVYLLRVACGGKTSVFKLVKN